MTVLDTRWMPVKTQNNKKCDKLVLDFRKNSVPLGTEKVRDVVQSG